MAAPFGDRRSRFLAGKLGLGIFLTSLGVLFGATLIGFLAIRVELAGRGAWPADLPRLPRGLWFSTITLVISSMTMQSGLSGIRAGRRTQLQNGMICTAMLGFLFLVFQGACWLTWLAGVWTLWDRSNEFRYALTSFYVLTGLHAAHVIGGLVPIIIVARNALHGMYSSAEYAGVHYCAMYWHFLGGVWIVLLAVMIVAI
jgi:cytochrome c oxidase subunit 3